MHSNQLYRLGLLLILVGGFHDLNLYGPIGHLGLVLVYLGGAIGVIGLVRSES